MIFTKKTKISSVFRGYTAFTLAEILIVIGIIGIVARMTIPTLLKQTNERATISMLKKSYANLSNAYKLAVQDEGTPENWGSILSPLVPFLSIAKNCLDGSKGCWPSGVTYMQLSPALGAYWVSFDNYNNPKLRLADGTMIFANVGSPTCSFSIGSSLALKNVCAWYTIDVNGEKKPNQIGKDTFGFYLTKYGIVPFGTALQTSTPPGGDVGTFTNGCKNSATAVGFGCSAWVLYNENQD